MSARARLWFELAGWLTFVASAGFYLLASLRAGDMLASAGSALFLIACFIFLVPLLQRPAQ